jgi:hypothetical protein
MIIATIEKIPLFNGLRKNAILLLNCSPRRPKPHCFGETYGTTKGVPFQRNDFFRTLFSPWFLPLTLLELARRTFSSEGTVLPSVRITTTARPKAPELSRESDISGMYIPPKAWPGAYQSAK